MIVNTLVAQVEQILLFRSALGKDDIKQELRGAISADAALKLLALASGYAKERAFDFAPIDRAGIEKLAQEYVKPTLQDTAKGLEGAKGVEDKLSAFIMMKPSEQLLSESPKKADEQLKGLAGLARSCFWNALLTAALKRSKTLKPLSDAKPGEVRFAANLDGWVFVKKAGTSGGRDDVLGALGGIYASASKKAGFYAANKDEAALENANQSCAKLLAGRRSIGRVAGALNELSYAAAEFSKKLSPVPDNQRFLEDYLFDAAMQTVGHAPYADNEDIGRVFPHLKVQKPRGNYGGKKK